MREMNDLTRVLPQSFEIAVDIPTCERLLKETLLSQGFSVTKVGDRRFIAVKNLPGSFDVVALDIGLETTWSRKTIVEVGIRGPKKLANINALLPLLVGQMKDILARDPGSFACFQSFAIV